MSLTPSDIITYTVQYNILLDNYNEEPTSEKYIKLLQAYNALMALKNAESNPSGQRKAKKIEKKEEAREEIVNKVADQMKVLRIDEGKK